MGSFSANWAEVAWAKLPITTRRRAVERLRYAFDPSFFAEVRKLATEKGLGDWLPPGWHFSQGMHVRNVLRSDGALSATRPPRTRLPLMELLGLRKSRVAMAPAPIPDADLPALPELYDGHPAQNWDDYYVQCIEAAAGLRSVEL